MLKLFLFDCFVNVFAQPGEMLSKTTIIQFSKTKYFLFFAFSCRKTPLLVGKCAVQLRLSKTLTS